MRALYNGFCMCRESKGVFIGKRKRGRGEGGKGGRGRIVSLVQ